MWNTNPWLGNQMLLSAQLSRAVHGNVVADLMLAHLSCNIQYFVCTHARERHVSGLRQSPRVI